MNLDNLEQIKKIDPLQLFESIKLLPYQIKQVLNDADKIKIKKTKTTITQIIIMGMGASNLGPEIIKSLFVEQIKIPILTYQGYQTPASINKNTLFILSSYSGNTEEVLNAYKKAQNKKAQIAVLTSGGKLGKIFKKNKLSGYIFDSKNNPLDVPRIGIGYSILSVMLLLSKFNLLKINKKTLLNSIANLLEHNPKLSPNSKIQKNLAKQIALKIQGKQAIIIGSEFLTGNTKTFRNQFCESGKNFASYLLLPDLNHFAIEGLSNPKSNSKEIIFLFINSNLYSEQIQKRSKLTKQIIKKNRIESLNIVLKNKTKLEQSFELLQLSTWVTYYTGLLNEENPATNNFVDWFKKRI